MGELDHALCLAHAAHEELDSHTPSQSTSQSPSSFSSSPCARQPRKSARKWTFRISRASSRVSNIIADLDRFGFLIHGSQLAIPSAPILGKYQRSAHLDAMSVKRYETGNRRDGHVPLENLVQDIWILEPVDKKVQTDEHSRRHEWEHNRIRGLQALGKSFLIGLLLSRLEFL